MAMVTMRPSVLALALLVLAGVTGCQPRPEVVAVSTPRSTEWIHATEVTYQENHDPSMVWLKDGRHLQVTYGHPSLDEVSAWQPGRTLRLAFSAATGPVLIDPETMGRLPVIGGLERDHPLDLLLRQNLEHSPDTISIVEAYVQNAARWETEVGRLYEELSEPAYLPAEVRDGVRQSARSWAEFQRHQVRGAGALLNLPAGTMWGIHHAEYAHRLVRQQALSLMTLLDAVGSARPEEPTPTPTDPAAPAPKRS
jgi:hypothetical protein